MNKFSRKISIAMRAERMIAHRRMEVIRTQTALMAAAGIVAGIGLIMANVAAYFALTTALSPQTAAFIVALVNFALAILLGVCAGRMNADADVRGAIEVRDMAVEDIEADVEDALQDVKDAVTDVRQLVKNPLGSALPSIIGPLLGILMKSGRKE